MHRRHRRCGCRRCRCAAAAAATAAAAAAAQLLLRCGCCCCCCDLLLLLLLLTAGCWLLAARAVVGDGRDSEFSLDELLDTHGSGEALGAALQCNIGII